MALHCLICLEVVDTLTALATYLGTQSYTNIFTNYMPDTPDECIGLFVWDQKYPDMGDGSSMRYVQIRVRRYDPAAAETACKAIVALLDSGSTERLITLSGITKCIGRPRRGPLIMSRTETTTTYYCEIALWGKN